MRPFTALILLLTLPCFFAACGGGGSDDLETLGLSCNSAEPELCEGVTFCKLDLGTCRLPAPQRGTCTRNDLQVCTEIYAPVCGCDLVTYSSECFSDSAGVSILHAGECTPADRV